MEIKDLKIGDKVSVEVGSQQFKDTDDEKWVYETIFGTAEVTKVNETYEYANVIFENGTYGEINTDGIVDNVQGYLTAERVIEILEEER